jgi:atypical dual specificity phosphatase
MRVRTLLQSVNLVRDPGVWLEEGRVFACRYPRGESALAELARMGISVLVNLHERGHDPSRLARYDLVEVHIPVKDFSAPSPEQIARGIAAITQAVTTGERVAVHCGGGLGRTGTLLACYLVHQGWEAEDAIDRVRAVRPSSVETAGQVAAVKAHAEAGHGS